MSVYYGIERSDDYLAHYGIKGMKWGVRKAIARGNQRALTRQYRKAAKKLAKLEARANTSTQLAKAKKWDKISSGARTAGRVGLGIAAAGTAYSGLPTNTVFGHAIGRNLLVNRVLNRNSEWRDKINKANIARDSDGWANQQHALREEAYKRGMNTVHTLDTLGRGAQTIGAGMALGSYASSAAAKIRANQLRKRATGAGHAKAVAEAKQFRNEMNKAFAGTKYAGKTAVPKRNGLPAVSVDLRSKKTRAANGATGSRIKVHSNPSEMNSYVNSVRPKKRRRR